jgi:hypothetical protein
MQNREPFELAGSLTLIGLSAHTRAPTRQKGLPMTENPSSYIRQMADHLLVIEQETLVRLGEQKAGLFVNIANDAIDINGAILDAYHPDDLHNLVFLAFQGVFKESCWFQFYFVAGQYPHLNARLRFVWESIFRAHWAETELASSAEAMNSPALSIDEKAAWLESKEHNLGWSNCTERTLSRVFPLVDREKEVRDHYLSLWQTLNKHVHPSMILTENLIAPPATLFRDGFNEQLALQTVEWATNVFDLAFLAVFHMFPKAADQISKKGLYVDYPILNLVFQNWPAE